MLKDIHHEMVNIAYGFFWNELEIFHSKSSIEKFEIIMETISFLFEDYQNEFDRIIHEIYSQEFDEEHLRIEQIIFLIGCTQHALVRLNERAETLIEVPTVKGQ